ADVYASVGSRKFQVIQQRSKGFLSFAQCWADYENGFGDDKDFWIGLRKINELTGNTPRRLRIEAVTRENKLYVAEYSDFSVGDASTNYLMTFNSYLSGSSNTSGDSLSINKGMKFSTLDRDNDDNSDSCSRESYGYAG
uniref:Fibrinogen C-terminal domain-containing protein n=1 Tax=Macrostomum lignano TaxID=282301 RepID=A0A1I8GS69_9PLAT